MSALICGSVAFDTIMVFHDQFRNHILPDKVHILNVCFLVPEMRREFGGCAGNIAYNLKLLGGNGYPMGTVGRDFSPYADWMDKYGISRKYIKQFDDTYTAQAFITTDMDDNQITAFHPGAMGRAHEQQVPAAGITLGMLSPDGRDAMFQHAAQFNEAGIPFIFDPGQGMPMFTGEELQRFVEQATWGAFNDYESQLMQEQTGLSPADMAQQLDGVIVTRGGEGSRIYTRDKVYEIPAVGGVTIVDPTGCGDAYRSGLIYGLMNELDWETTGRLAALMGAIKVEHHGTQNHSPDSNEIRDRFKDSFGYVW